MKTAILLRRLTCLLAGGALALEAAAATTRYVSPTGLHIAPYESWTDAATNFAAALAVCEPLDTVVVADGAYLLDATLRVTNQVTLTSQNGRDAVRLDAGALPAGHDAVFLQFGTLDGFTISNAPRHGVKSESGSVFNSRITHSGRNGIDSYTAPRLVTNSTLIVTNTLVQHSGSNGIFTCAVDTQILGCHISGSQDAGVSLRQNDTVAPLTLPRVSNFLIRASTVASNLNSGIALAFWNYSAEYSRVPVHIEDCLIADNAGLRGGGIADAGGSTIDRSSGVLITGSLIRRNQASSHGGGVFFQSSRNPVIRRSILEDNVSGDDGGGIFFWSGSMDNCIVRRNTCADAGGGACHGILRQNTFLFNQAARGGGVYQSLAGNTIHNSIVYYNQAPLSTNLSTGSGSHNYVPPVTGTHAPPGLAGVRNWRLMPGSPCIDAGSLAETEGDFDLGGSPRIWGGGVDIGCSEFYPPGLGGPLAIWLEASATRAVAGFMIHFECDIEGQPAGYQWSFSDGFTTSNTPFLSRSFDAPGVHTATVTAWNPDGTASNSITFEIYPGYTNYVSLAGMHVPPFTNWPDAATNIQEAISANIPGGVVRVADGVYDTGGVAVNSSLTNRIAITSAVEVVSANGPAAAFIVGRGPVGPEAVRCAYVGSGARLIGFTLTNGHTLAAGDASRDRSGGGAWCEPDGGIADCQVVNNAAGFAGGGIRHGTAWTSTFRENSAQDGGGAYDTDLVRCELSGNIASGEGGGLHGGISENVLLTGNQAAFGGGAARATLMHATLASNHATESGGGAYRGVLSNSIVYFNTAGTSWPNYLNAVLRYSCTFPDPQSTGNLTNEPRFAEAAAGNYRLRGDSPALGTALPTGIPEDLLGVSRPRPEGLAGAAAPDMGAYEYTAAHYVAPAGAHVWPFLTWADAAHDIQAAVDAADPLDHVFVSNGIYNTGGRVLHGSLTNRVLIDNAIHVLSVNGHGQTIIEGAGPAGDAAVRGVYLGTGATLDGFTVRGGHTRTAGDEILERSGGGIWAAPDAVISHSHIEDSAASAMGGGVYGGRLVNSFLTANTAAQGGGLARSRLEYCTVTYNDAAEGGGAFESTGRYSIVYFNAASAADPNIHGGAWEHSCTTPDPGGPGHITIDPRLQAAADFRLELDSPCVDAIPAPDWIPDRDLAGNPRPLDGDVSGIPLPDIGAHESVSPAADTDGDGLDDYAEIFLHRTDPLVADTDGDGQSDGAEIVAGTDPLDPGDFFAVASFIDQSIAWPGLTGRLYTVFAAEAPEGAWTNRPDYTDQPGASGFMTYSNPASAPPRQFFGVRVRMAP
jgi:hypothetical protein